ncbi:cell division protein SepF [Corynebacterium vitaeruminis]|uniref:cell division protein SepF n=1 Tax=Corynebacterium vitaeruminis TaxID=38305 RepID=UPI0005512C99|nr:cell division protein SepF [Corynebacterium vitaeruminis]
MSFVKKTKEFFGLTPYELEGDDAYYEEPRYEGSVAYQPRYDERPSSEREVREPRETHLDRSFPATIVPVTINSYSDAAAIGKPFRDGDAVVFDIRNLGAVEAKRIVDFAAGLCFAVYGQMKKIDTGVFAIVPKDADVTTAELERTAGVR